MKKNIPLLFIIFHFIFSPLRGQTRTIDSLRQLIKSEKDDTNKVNIINTLCIDFKNIGSNDSALHYANNSQLLANKLEYKKGLAVALRIIGVVYYHKSDYTNALQYLNNALSMHKEMGSRAGIAGDLNNIGNVYDAQGNYPKALESHLEALRINEETKDKVGCSKNYTNIGLIYFEQGNNTLALQYYFKALALDQELGDKDGTASDFGNIGSVYTIQQNIYEALVYEQKALAINQEIGDKEGIAHALFNIGAIYADMFKYEQSLDYTDKALAIDREIGDKDDIAQALNELGYIYLLEKKYKQAKSYLDSALTASLFIGDKDIIKSTYNFLTVMDSESGNYRQEVEDYSKFIKYRDSLKNEDITKKMVQAEMTYGFNLKNDSVKAVQDKKDAVTEKEKQKQRLILYSFMGGFVLMLALAFFIYRGYRQKQVANIIITQQKEEVEYQKQKVDAAYHELHEKHKEITDSINYAKRIQQALFKDEEYVTLHLPEHFILFKPRDVVSGDFYWGHEKEGHWYIAAVDCTGHGVPGAFLTMLGSAFLNEICSFGPLLAPAEVLNQLREKVVNHLSGYGEVKDGMDISLCRINMNTRELQWAGANNPLCYIQDNEIKEIDADKQPIGYQAGQKLFTNHSIQLKKNDIIYVFTDGYADQFGGPKGKKFKYKLFAEKLIGISNYPLKEQKLQLGKVFDEWKGNNEQTDDMLVIGVRV